MVVLGKKIQRATYTERTSYSLIVKTDATSRLTW